MLCILIAAVVVSSGSITGQEKSPNPEQAKQIAKDLRSMQGTWELTRRVKGKTLRSVKTIEGNRTKLTRYENDKVYWAHTSEFQLSIVGQTRVFTFFNLEVTDGPAKGTRKRGKSSFIYKVDDKTLTEATGLMLSDTDPPRLTTWRRVGARADGKTDKK